MIKNHQSLNENHRLYVCDLHFNSEFLQVSNKRCTLKKGAIPNLRYFTMKYCEIQLNERIYF